MGVLENVKKEIKVDTSPHVIIQALAGTGKTTTLVEGLKVLRFQKPSITPSKQQLAVWDALTMSDSKATVCFVAFNKSIATELQSRVPTDCSAMTLHSMGYASVRQVFSINKPPNPSRVLEIISELLNRDIRDVRTNDMEFLRSTEKLVGLCKANLIQGDENGLMGLCSHYDIELNGNQRRVFDIVPNVLERCKDVAKDGCIDFDDMVWLPVVLDLPSQHYDLLLVDESQDLNRCQQALTMKTGNRLVLCGDKHQAIYGFAGADAESMQHMENVLNESDRGVIILPLTQTRRCGHAIVAEANKIVITFEAHENNPKGCVSNGRFRVDSDEKNYTAYQNQVKDGDMCICRVNAPLVQECFRFIKSGKKATIQGRDIGQGLINTIKKMKAIDIVDLTCKLSDWLHFETKKENAKRFPNEQRIITLQDRYDCLTCFCDGAVTIEEVTKRIENIFTDNKDNPGIRLSSIHKAKGLEADRVFLLEPEGATVPHPMAKSAWQVEQEWNLRYVAITRAIHELVYVK